MAGQFTFQPGSSASSRLAGLLISGSAHTLLVQGLPAHAHALDLIRGKPTSAPLAGGQLLTDG
jgi:hypothetical protein